MLRTVSTIYPLYLTIYMVFFLSFLLPLTTKKVLYPTLEKLHSYMQLQLQKAHVIFDSIWRTK